MILGFTGTRNGMTTKQLLALQDLFLKYDLKEFHHGDCVGADGEAADLVDVMYNGLVHLVLHPPVVRDHRAFKQHLPNTTVLPAKDYIPRDYDIVDACERLIAASKSKKELIRSGTWTTVRYARRKKKPISIIFPDGTIKEE